MAPDFKLVTPAKSHRKTRPTTSSTSVAQIRPYSDDKIALRITHKTEWLLPLYRANVFIASNFQLLIKRHKT